MNKKTVSKDHKGIKYDSLKAMCDAYDITPTLYLKRMERGWSQQEALEGKKPYFSRGGVDYYTQKEVCEAFKIHPNSFRLKLKNGYSIDEIVDGVSYRAEDHLGEEGESDAREGVHGACRRAGRRTP